MPNSPWPSPPPGQRSAGRRRRAGSAWSGTPGSSVENLRATFAEARRVLADDGTCWLNLGDVYVANSDGWARGKDYNHRQSEVRPRARLAVPPKNMLGMPWRVAFALQEDGWILGNAIVWHKPNAMPQSVTDRLSNRYELIFGPPAGLQQAHAWHARRHRGPAAQQDMGSWQPMTCPTSLRDVEPGVRLLLQLDDDPLAITQEPPFTAGGNAS
ncbi:DNA methyltransferase [Microbispora rosea]|uniref:DNA methyltransferase n=1 Tax=Microbispora rosea TaxID=58117 RepID=UPI0023B30A84|nr:DNA methyltransferase [Microbispora rosea]